MKNVNSPGTGPVPPSTKVQLSENLPPWLERSDMKTTKTAELDEVTVDGLGVEQYVPITDDDVDTPSYKLT